MKFSALATTLLAICAPALAATNNVQVANKIDREAFHIKAGKYRLCNAKTQQCLKFVKKGNQIFSAKGKGSFMSISTHHAHVIVSPSQSNRKCLSAAWNYDKGADSQGALYACKHKRDDIPLSQQLGERDMMFSMLDFSERDDIPEDLVRRDNATVTLEKRVPLRGAKQYFYLHPSSWKNAVHIIAYDHIKDMPTRVLGATSHGAAWDKHVRYQDIVRLNENDKGNAWYLYNAKGQQLKFKSH